MKRGVLVCSFIIGCMLLCGGCGSTQSQQETEEEVSFEEIVPKGEEPIIIRDEKSQDTSTEEETQEPTSQEEQEVTAYADLQQVSYQLETAQYEDGVVKITYPQVTQMENQQLQETINQNILAALKPESWLEQLSAYELSYEVATQGTGVLSVVFRGFRNTQGSAYPVNIVKTLNIDMTTGENVRLKDYADLAQIVSGLEMASGYEILSEGVQMQDFSAFLNNGYVTDYAITMLDYDIDFHNLEMYVSGYSCIRDNHVVLFIEAEHVMGDYVELMFDSTLTQ